MGGNLTNFSPIFGPSIGRSISPYNLAFLRANLAMGRKSQIFIKKLTRSACVSSRHCRRARRFSRQIVMARPAPLVARSTATGHSRAESPERPTRASRETDGCRLVARKLMWRRKSQFFWEIYTGQMTVRDSRKFAKNLGKKKGGKFPQIFPQKIIAAIFRQAIEVQNLLKNLLSFLPTGLNIKYTLGIS